MKRAIAGLLLCAVSAYAQQPYLETFDVRLHNLEVVVTDASGKPVRGLTKDDFLVFENGAQQSVTNFSVYDSSTSAVTAAGAGNNSSSEELLTVPEAPPPRRVVFFIDDMAMQNAARKTLAKQAVSLLDQLQPADLVAVVRPTGERIAQNYTTDRPAVRTALIEAIESCTVRADAPGLQEYRELVQAMDHANDEQDRKYAKALYAERSRDRVQQRLEQLRAWIGSAAGVEGRKILIVITSGLSSQPGRDVVDPEDQIMAGSDRFMASWATLVDLQPVIDELARDAAANGVTIYALEPEEPLAMEVEPITAASKNSGSTFEGGHAGGERSLPKEMFRELQKYKRQTLTSFAEKTGGRWFRGPAVMDDLFRQVSSDLSSYYSLAYRATQHSEPARRIEVKIRNRPELHARTRTEVIDKSPEDEMPALVLSSLLFPRSNNELRLAVTAGQPVKEKNLFSIPIDVVIPLDKLTFLRTNDHRYASNVDIHFAVTGRTAPFTTSGHHQQNIEISEQQYDARAGVTYRFKTSIQTVPGEMRIAIGVLDSASRLTGFRNVEVNAK